MQVVLIAGDGIGPEVTSATQEVVAATGVKIDWEVAELNSDLILKTGQSVPQSVIDSIERTGIARLEEDSGDGARRSRGGQRNARHDTRICLGHAAIHAAGTGGGTPGAAWAT